MFGLAIGDALGAPTEFLSLEQIIERFGPFGPSEPSKGVTEHTRCAIAQFQAALTHAHPTALAAADLTAMAVADLAAGGDVSELTQRLRDYCESRRTVYHHEWLGDLWQRPEIASPEEFI